MTLPQCRSGSRRLCFFCKKIPNWSFSEEEIWGCQLLQNLALSVRNRERGRWSLQRRKITRDSVKQVSRFCFKVHCSAIGYKEFSKSLCKKWVTGSESSPRIHCEAEKKEGNSLFYPAVFCSDDEHLLIQHYCQSLNQESPLSQPRSPAQILISLESEERGELERILADLEEENRWVTPPATELEVKSLQNTYTLQLDGIQFGKVLRYKMNYKTAFSSDK